MDDIQAGEIAEVIVKENIEKVTSLHRYIYIVDLKELYRRECQKADDTKEEYVGHIDVYCQDTKQWREIKLNKEQYKHWAERYQNCGGMDLLGFTRMNAARIEVKADRNCRFLHLDTPNNSDGSIAFELWANQKYAREYWTYGWLYGYLYPEKYSKERILKTREQCRQNNTLEMPSTYFTPDVLVFVLENEIGDEVVPYATVCFENTMELFSYLNKKMYGLLYPKWSIDPTTIKKDKRFNGLVEGNLLYVSLKELMDNVPGITVNIWDTFPTIEDVKEKADIRYWKTKNKEWLTTKRTEFLHTVAISDEAREISLWIDDTQAEINEQKLLREFKEWMLSMIEKKQETIWPYYLG